MTERDSVAEPLDDVLFLNLEGYIGDPALRAMADCIRELRPVLDDCTGQHGYGTTMASLITLVANYAIAGHETTLIADAFRQNAEMLDVEGRIDSIAGNA